MFFFINGCYSLLFKNEQLMIVSYICDLRKHYHTGDDLTGLLTSFRPQIIPGIMPLYHFLALFSTGDYLSSNWIDEPWMCTICRHGLSLVLFIAFPLLWIHFLWIKAFGLGSMFSGLWELHSLTLLKKCMNLLVWKDLLKFPHLYT